MVFRAKNAFADCFILRYFFILLYANREKIRFYERNGFLEFEEYMEKENKAEINANLPMYMKLC